MDGVFVVIDGLSDRPNKQLGGKTPLEAAKTPNMDFLATRGEVGVIYPVRPNYIPESDESLMSLFGNNIDLEARGQLEALGAGIEISRGDLALRANFATIDSLESGSILDRRAGRNLSTSEAEELAEAINKIGLTCGFEFKPTIQHKAVLVLKGGFSENVVGNDVTYSSGKKKELEKVRKVTPLDDEDNTHYTVNIINEFLDKSHEVLRKHPVNKERARKGLMPANYLLLRSPGIEIPKLKQYKDWMAVTYMPLERGFAKASGMNVFDFDYPKLKDLDAYENLWKGLKGACKFAIKGLKKNKDRFKYAYIHLPEPDFAGHDNKPFEKKNMIEHIDDVLFGFLRSFAPPNNIVVVCTGNNSTVCRLKGHTEDPVPIFVFNGGIPREKTFDEENSRNGALGRIMGKDFLKKIGFSK